MTVLGRDRLPARDGGEDSEARDRERRRDVRLFLTVAYQHRAAGTLLEWIAAGPSRWRLGIGAALESPAPRVARRAAALALEVSRKLAPPWLDGLPPEERAALEAWASEVDALPHSARRAATWRAAGRPRRRRRP